jgi:hypothetical protein
MGVDRPDRRRRQLPAPGQAGAGRQDLDPLDRIDYAVLALKALADLVSAAGDKSRGDELAVLISLVAEEFDRCAEELRRKKR